MKNKIAAISSFLFLTAPAFVYAQFSAPTNTGLPSGSLYDIINTVMKWLLGLISIIAIIGFVVAGILYLTAAGDEKRIETAKKAMIYSIVGVIVALIGLVIIMAVNNMLSAENSQF